jgi:hypothetical protein
MIHEIVEKTASVGYSPGLKDALDECRMVMACHGALRANQALTEKQIEKLLRQLDALRSCCGNWMLAITRRIAPMVAPPGSAGIWQLWKNLLSALFDNPVKSQKSNLFTNSSIMTFLHLFCKKALQFYKIDVKLHCAHTIHSTFIEGSRTIFFPFWPARCRQNDVAKKSTARCRFF